MKIPRWAWLVWLGIFVVLEAIALFDGIANDTLTETLHHGVPGWAVFMFLGWLCYHFLQTYLGGKRDGR